MSFSFYESFGDISHVSPEKMVDPLENLRIDPHFPQSMLEAILHWSFNTFGQEEFIDAKGHFYDLTGRVNYDDDCFHARMSYFLDFFCFQRPLQCASDPVHRGMTPYHAFLDSQVLTKINAPQPLIDDFVALGRFRHSIFEITKINKRGMRLYDLLKKQKYVIDTGSLVTTGFSADSLLQGFLFERGEQAFISTGMILHPGAVKRLVKKRVSASFKDETFNEFSFLTRLAKQNMSLKRHRHRTPEEIYRTH